MFTFATPRDRHCTERLMQPALIRVVDNLRKALEASDWQGHYEEIQLWPPQVSPETIHQVKTLQAAIATASPAEKVPLEAQLAQLPTPYPSHELHLSRGDTTHVVSLWELCCCVCFQSYPSEAAVTVDQSLWDDQDEEVDWLAVDTKAKGIVADIFDGLAAAAD